MFLPVSLCHDSRAGSRFLSSAGKLNSPASNWRANWPENYASNLWLQQRIIPRRWEGGELGYNSEDFWLFGVVLETWFGKSKKMGKWKGWEEPWDAQDSWRRGRDERGQWKIWRRWSGEALSSCWRKAFPLLLVCPPLLIPPSSSVLPLPVHKEGCKCPDWRSWTCCSTSSRANEANGFLGH